MLTFEGQVDPDFSQSYALARVQEFRRRVDGDRVGLFSVPGVTDLVNDMAAKGTYVNMANLPETGQVGVNLLLPNGMTVASQAQVRAGAIPSYPNGQVFAYAQDARSGNQTSGGGAGNSAAAAGVTALFAKTSADGAVEAFSKVPMAKTAPARSIVINSAKAAGDGLILPEYGAFGGGPSGVAPVNISLTWSGALPAELVYCEGRQLGTGPAGNFAGVAEVLVDYPVANLHCHIWSTEEIREMASATMAVPVGSPEQQARTKERRDDIDKKNREDQKKAEDERKKVIEELGPLVPSLPGAGPTDPPPMDPPIAELPPVVPVAPVVPKPAPAGGGNPTGGGNPVAPVVIPPVVAPPAVVPPAVQQPVFNCATIVRGQFKSGAEGDFWRATCPGGALDCNTIRAISSVNRTDRENTWFVQNCAIQTPVPQVAPVNICATEVVDGGGVPGGVGQTRPLDARCSYRVCLMGTITGTGGAAGTGKSYTPAAALMKASPGGSLAGGCVSVSKFGGSVVFSCDGSAFPGIKFSGGFTYSVTRVGLAQ
jgi:hypothetical protein